MTGESRKPRSRELVEHLKRSQIYRHYERAFRDTTGNPLALHPPESFNLPHHDDPKKNPFCVIMAQTNHSCSACIQLQQELEKEAHFDPKTLFIFAKASELIPSALPAQARSSRNLRRGGPIPSLPTITSVT